jgi:TolB-like protein/cytochrome c-type biogenesis protein CcmH/NrfG
LSLFNELKRRNVIKVTIAYIVMAWLVMQVADVILNNIVAPGWIFHVLLLFLAIGLPFAVFFAWAFEMTPEGIKRESDVDRSQSITTRTGRKLDFLIIGVLVLGLGYFAYDKFVLSTSRDAALVETTKQAVTEQAAAEPEVAAESHKSIAVLPFVNMSSDEEQEYFSDGLSEELLNLLAKIPQLQVAARTSSFSLKGKDLQISEVGKILKVAHVLEGSVRKAGNQVRITAQLIKADDGYHLWSETYDRKLDDIFAIQDEIASAVVEQLKITLLGDAPSVRETDPKAYAFYLQARQLGRQGTADSLERSNALYQQAMAIDPEYAAGWAGLATNYRQQSVTGLMPTDEGRSLAREAANKALSIDPEFAPAHAMLGNIAITDNADLADAAQHLERALELEPGNTEILRAAANLYRVLGRLDRAIAVSEYMIILDPVNPDGYYTLGLMNRYSGKLDAALEAFQTTLSLSPGRIIAHYGMSGVLLIKDEPEAALAAIEQEESIWRLIGLPMVYHALGQVDESNDALAMLIEEYEQDVAYNIAYILAFRGEVDRAFEWLDKAVQYNDPGLSDIAIYPLFTMLHDDPRWLPLLESLGRSLAQLNAIEFNVKLPD